MRKELKERAYIAGFQNSLNVDSIGIDAIIICDHDGPDGRWVGEYVTIKDYDLSNRQYPFRVKNNRNGADMWCSALMLGPVR